MDLYGTYRKIIKSRTSWELLYITNLDHPYHNANTFPRIDIELVKTEQPDTPAHMSLVLKGSSKEKSGGRDEAALEAELAVFQRFLGATRKQVSAVEVKTEELPIRKESVRKDSLAVAEEVRQEIGARMPGSVEIARLVAWNSIQQNPDEDPMLKEWDEDMLILGSDASSIITPLRRIDRHNSRLTDTSSGLLTVDSIRALNKKGLLALNIRNLGDKGEDILLTLFAPIEESQKRNP